jgi:Multicopper oxidase
MVASVIELNVARALASGWPANSSTLYSASMVFVCSFMAGPRAGTTRGHQASRSISSEISGPAIMPWLRKNVPAWEKGRKDVFRLRPGGSVTLTLQFRDWGGFMEHCHNTVHEDNAMLLRWDLDTKGTAVLQPMPTPIATPNGVTFADPSARPGA